MSLWDKQMQRQTQKVTTSNSGRRTAFQFGNGKIDLLLSQQIFRSYLVRVAQRQPQLRKGATMLFEQVREVIAQNRARRGEPQTLGSFASQTRSRFFDLAKEWFDECEQLVASWREGKWSTLEEFETEIFFQLENLTAHRWLLNPVLHVPHGFADAAMFRDVVEEF
jgi:hypothetical protein